MRNFRIAFPIANDPFGPSINAVDENGCTPTDQGWQCGPAPITNPNSGADVDPWCMNPMFPNDVSKQVKCRTLNQFSIASPSGKPIIQTPPPARNPSKGVFVPPPPPNQNINSMYGNPGYGYSGGYPQQNYTYQQPNYGSLGSALGSLISSILGSGSQSYGYGYGYPAAPPAPYGYY